MKIRSILAIAALASLGSVANAFTVISSGHYDLGVGLHGGELEPHIHGHGGGGTEFEPDEAGFWVKDNHITTRPASSAWGFIGVGSGAQYHRLRSASATGQIYLGWGAEEIDAGTLDSYTLDDTRIEDRYGSKEGEWVKFQLKSVSAPAGGQFSVFETAGSALGSVWMATSDGIDSSDYFALSAASHEHLNLGFSTPGHYHVTFTVSAFLGGNLLEKDATYIFGVGDNFEPVPEPATMAALGLGAAAMLRRRRR